MTYDELDTRSDDQALDIIRVIEALHVALEKLAKAQSLSRPAILKTIKRFRQAMHAMLEDVPTQFRPKIEAMVEELVTKQLSSEDGAR